MLSPTTFGRRVRATLTPSEASFGLLLISDFYSFLSGKHSSEILFARTFVTRKEPMSFGCRRLWNHNQQMQLNSLALRDRILSIRAIENIGQHNFCCGRHRPKRHSSSLHSLSSLSGQVTYTQFTRCHEWLIGNQLTRRRADVMGDGEKDREGGTGMGVW